MNYYTNPKFYLAILYDTLFMEDKAAATLGLDTYEEKQEYRIEVATICAVLGIVLAPFTYGISLALLGVTLRKWMINEHKAKQHAAEIAAGVSTPSRTEVLSPMLAVPGVVYPAGQGIDQNPTTQAV